MKRLTITADDYGIHKTIDDAIIECVKAGNIDNVDCVVTVHTPHYNSIDAINRLKTDCADLLAQKKLSIGLHVSLTCGTPATGAKHSQLFCDGEIDFNPLETFNFNSFQHYNTQISLALKEELEAQYHIYLALLSEGHMPHISCHAGVFHMTEPLTKVYFNHCTLAGAHVRNPFLLSTLSDRGYPPIAPDRLLKEGNGVFTGTEMVEAAFKRLKKNIKWRNRREIDAVLKYKLTKKLKKLYNNHTQQKGMKTTDYFIDHFYMVGQSWVLHELFSHLHHYSYEMVVHPIGKKKINDIPSGVDSDAFEGRFNEYQLLKKKNFIRDYVDQYNEEHTTYPWDFERFVIA